MLADRKFEFNVSTETEGNFWFVQSNPRLIYPSFFTLTQDFEVFLENSCKG